MRIKGVDIVLQTMLQKAKTLNHNKGCYQETQLCKERRPDMAIYA